MVVVNHRHYVTTLFVCTIHLLLNCLAESPDSITLSEGKSEGMVNVAIFNLIRDVVDFEWLLWSWNRQQNCHHRVKGDRNSIAYVAVDCTLELAVEQISDN